MRLRVLVLDTNVPGEAGGRLCATRLSWLAEQLARAGGRPVVIAMHHPPFVTGIPFMDACGLDRDDTAALAAIVTRHPSCDGGGDACTLRIGEVNQVPLAESATPIDLTAGGSDALIELSIDGSGNIFLTLTQNGVPETSLSAQLATPFDVERFGFIVGREPDGSLSCIDDLQLAVEVN